MADDPAKPDLHFIGEFSKLMESQAQNDELDKEKRKQSVLTAISTLRAIVFNMFNESMYITKEETIAFVQDTIANNSNVRYDNLVRLWYTQWEISNMIPNTKVRS